MPVYDFKAQFVAAVESGAKTCTIRPERDRPTKIGDTLYLYAGLRTKACRLIGTAICTDVCALSVSKRHIWSEDARRVLTPTELDDLARDDGFQSVQEFFQFFIDTYELGEYAKPMELIIWKLQGAPQVPGRTTAPADATAAGAEEKNDAAN